MSAESVDKISSNEEVREIAIDANCVLEELRQFCANYFMDTISDQQKTELKQSLYTYLMEVIPELCQKLNEKVFNSEPNIVHIKSLCYVFGDIHGNVLDMYDYEKMFWASNEKTTNFLFLGDYVDRGKYGVEVCVYLFALKLLYPKQFTLIRGNHEFRDIQIGSTFHEECKEKFGEKIGKSIWSDINTCFDRMPLVAIIDNQIFCCHGGVPKGTVTLRSIEQIPKPLVNLEQSLIAEDILWNDPIESMKTYSNITQKRLKSKKVEFVSNRIRGAGHHFTALGVQRFLQINGLEYIIRAHEAVNEGFKFTSNDRVITIFSSSNYCGKNNTTACVRVTAESIEIIVIKVPKSSKK